jgi:hypothetical protein
VAFDKEQFKEVFFKLGIAFIILGALVFFGATPRRMEANPVGGPWLGAAALVGLGVCFPALDRYLNR